MTGLQAAWAAIHEHTPEGWYVGRLGYQERYRQWSTRCGRRSGRSA